MPMTSYLRKKDGDHNLGKSAFTMPTTVYLGLFQTNPGDSGSQTGEVTGTGYARISATAKFDAFVLGTGIATSNAEFNFGSPGSDWGTLAYVGILDASSGGNMLYYEAIPNPRSATSGSRSVKFAAGQVQIRHV